MARKLKLTKQTLKSARFSKFNLAVFILIFAGIGGYILLSGHAAGFTGNIFVSPLGSDTGINCKRFTTATAPPADQSTWCFSLQKAWDLRQPGDVIGVGPGVYPTSQRISDTVDLGDPNVQFWPTDTAQPTQFGAEAVLAADYQGYPTNSLSFQINDASTLGSPAPTTFMIGQDVFTGCSVSGASPATVNCTGSNKPRVTADGTYSYLAGTTVEASSATSFPSPAGFSCAGCKHAEFHDFNYAVLAIGNKEGSVSCDPNCHASTDLLFDGGQARIIGGNGGGIDQITYENMTIGPETAGVTSHYQTFAGQPNVGTITFSHDHWYRQGSSWGCVLSGEASWDGSYCHSECLYINAGTIIIDHSLFEGCSQTAIFYQPGTSPGGLRYTSIRMSNSIIGPVHPDAGGTHISVDLTYRPNTDLEDLSLVNNSWIEGVLAFNPTDFASYCTTNSAPDPAKCVVKNWTFRNNAGGIVYNSGGTYCTNTSQIPGIVYDKDTWVGGTACPGDNPGGGTLDKLFADYSNLDFHPAAESPLVGAADQSSGNFPADDYYGTARTGGTVDGGAVQTVKAASVWVSTTGNDATCARGDQTKPCATFNQAYQLADCGDNIAIEDGAYSSQTINSSPKSCTSDTPLVFMPATGSSPTIGGLDVENASYITFKDLNLASSTATILSSVQSPSSCGSSYITLDHLTARNFSVAGYVCNIKVLGGSYGPSVDQPSVIAPYNGGDWPGPDSVLVDGASFSVSTDGSAGVHTECLHEWGNGLNVPKTTSNITIQNSRFDPCPQDNGTGTVTGDANIGAGTNGLTVQNNFFGYTQSPANAVGFGFDSSNVVFQYNSGAAGISWANTESACTLGIGKCGPWTIRGNYMPIGYGGCASHVSGGGPSGVYPDVATYSYNAWKSDGGGGTTTCGPSDVFVPSLDFINTAVGSMDLHLSGPAASAIGKGEQNNCSVATDIDGNNRPQGSACDAGADEYTSGEAGITGDLNSDGHVNITDLSIMLSHYGQTATASQGDLNNDGQCTITDLSILLSHYGT